MTSRSELANTMTSPTAHLTMSEGLSLLLRGIIPPMVTPLRDRDALDVSDFDRLVQHMLNGGVYGLFILGTTGKRTTPLKPEECL
jgi:hypothetical protein